METKENKNNWMKNSISLKTAVIGILVLILLIPAGMVKSLVNERQMRMQETYNEITQKWGGSQTIAGPAIVVPCEYIITTGDKIHREIQYLHILPQTLNVNGKLSPEKRHRGIYNVIVYKSHINIDGSFDMTTIEEMYPDHTIIWDKARIITGISDTRGIRQNIIYNINGKEVATQPGTSFSQQFGPGVNANIDLSETKKIKFSGTIKLDGSGLFNVLPLGSETNLAIESSWPHPQFDGSFLPDTEEIRDNGFVANWKVLEHNRNYPQHWMNTITIDNSGMGVELIEAVDVYQKSFRAVKYAILFIILTFLVFFFTEILVHKKAHPVQYLMAGAALVIFFSLLISLSEHIDFNLAYAVASITIISIITLFTHGVFKLKKVSITVLSVLSALFLFLFVILQVADYSLIIGNIGLVVILSVIMYISRKVDWFREKETKNNY